jgi:hypothetical protein
LIARCALLVREKVFDAVVIQRSLGHLVSVVAMRGSLAVARCEHNARSLWAMPVKMD